MTHDQQSSIAALPCPVKTIRQVPDCVKQVRYGNQHIIRDCFPISLSFPDSHEGPSHITSKSIQAVKGVPCGIDDRGSILIPGLAHGVKEACKDAFYCIRKSYDFPFYFNCFKHLVRGRWFVCIGITPTLSLNQVIECEGKLPGLLFLFFQFLICFLK